MYVQPSSRVDFVVFSDASLTGLGVCVLTPSGPMRVFAAQTPVAFSNSLPAGSNEIFILGLIAALMALKVMSFLSPVEGSNIVLFIDNNASLASIVRAFSKCPVGFSIVSEFWRLADSLSIVPWVERVESSLNLADAPSRLPGPEATFVPFENVWTLPTP